MGPAPTGRSLIVGQAPEAAHTLSERTEQVGVSG